MKSNERHTEEPNSWGNLKGTMVCSIFNQTRNFQLYREPLRNFYSKNPKIYNSSAPENLLFQSQDVAYLRNRGYICYFHRKFYHIEFKFQSPQCKFFDLAYI